MCVTVLKQRCRDHGVARWPYRKVKKLDTIINALETTATTSTATTTSTEDGVVKAKERRGRPSMYDQQSRLETVKRTRDLLITQPNSKAHLKVRKLDKTTRKRMASSMDDARCEDSSGDDRSFKAFSYATVGGASNLPVSNSPKRSKASRDGVESEETSASLGGVLGRLLEAAHNAEKIPRVSKPQVMRPLKIDVTSSGRNGSSTPSPGSSNGSDQMPFSAARSTFSMFPSTDFLRAAMPVARTSPAHIPTNITRPIPRKFNTETVLASLANQIPGAGGFQAFWHSLSRFGSAPNPSSSPSPAPPGK